MMRHLQALIVISWLATTVCVCASELSLRLSTAGGSGVVQAGEQIGLRIEYRNTGSDGLFLYRSSEVGPGALDIVARRGTAEAHCSAPSFTYDRAARQLFVVPLLEGRALLEEVVVNDVIRLESPILQLDPGEHFLSAVFVGSAPSDDARPWWRGRAVSNELRIQVSAPAKSVLDEWRGKLESYLASTGSDASPSAGYFSLLRFYSVVRDPSTTELLWNLLARLEWDAGVVRAIAFQRRCEDLPRIEALRETPWYSSGKQREFIREMVDQVRSGGRCGGQETR